MTTKQQNFIAMAKATANVIKKWQNEWSSNKRFTTEVELLNKELTDIDTLTKNTLSATDGVSENKYNAKEEALTAIVNIAKPASVYAQDQNNLPLQLILNQSKGNLTKLSQHELVNTLTNIYSKIDEIKEHLADYGIAPDKITAAKQKLDAYAKASPEPRNAIVERKSGNEAIASSIDLLRQSLYKTDNLMKLFTETPFYAEYKNARIIIDLGSRKTSPPMTDNTPK